MVADDSGADERRWIFLLPFRELFLSPPSVSDLSPEELLRLLLPEVVDEEELLFLRRFCLCSLLDSLAVDDDMMASSDVWKSD